MLNGKEKEPQYQAKLLGIILDQQLTFRDCITKEPKKVNSVCVWNHNTTRLCEERNDRYGSQKSFFWLAPGPFLNMQLNCVILESKTNTRTGSELSRAAAWRERLVPSKLLPLKYVGWKQESLYELETRMFDSNQVNETQIWLKWGSFPLLLATNL